MNPVFRGVVIGVILMAVFAPIYHSNILHLENTLYTQQDTELKTKFIPKQILGHFQNLTQKYKCRVNIVDNLTTSGLNAIQNERKSRIKDVCEQCRRNRTSMECNHITLNEDEHDNFMYHNILVDDMHQVSVVFQ